MVEQKNPVGPALNALEVLRADVLRRIGKEGGNLNGKIKANFAVIEQTLSDIETIASMNKTIGQQSQLVAKVINDMGNKLLPAADTDNGDDGSSSTKGE